jgi:hypothetical protein
MPDGGPVSGDTTAEGKHARPLGRGAFLKVILFVAVVFALALIMYQFAYGPIHWGREGDPELTIALDAETMPLDGSITCIYTITNAGDSDLRVLPPSPFSLALVDSNNTSVQWVGPVYAPPPPYTNDDLITLKAGESRSWDVIISGSRWDLRANETYKVVARYKSREEGRVTLPYWRGELTSNEVRFSVDA